MINNTEQNIQRIQRLGLSCILNDNGRERHFHHGHEYVEIGGIKWATMNIGANSVADYNCLYFQWGDTKGYSVEQIKNKEKVFNWEDYKYSNGASDPIYTDRTKYNSIDGKTVLDLEDDAVRANWGGQWRMPTTDEIQALGAAADADWINNYQGSGVNGMLCVDKTDKSKVLFFPAVGYCYKGIVKSIGRGDYYWSSSLYSDCPDDAWGLYFFNGGANWGCFDNRFYGYHVRGVVG